MSMDHTTASRPTRRHFPRKRIAAAAGSVAAVGAAAFLVLGPQATAEDEETMAGARDGVCDDGEFCLFYNSDHQGSISDFDTSVPDYGDSQPSCYDYKGSGAGQGDCVKNDAAAAWNRTDAPVTLYFNSDYGGSGQTFDPGDKVNLSADLKNENASHRLDDDGGGNEEPPPPGGDYDPPEANPHPEDSVVAPDLTERSIFVRDEIERLTPEQDCSASDFRPGESETSNHNTGNALDCTVSDAIGEFPTEAQRLEGWELANWLREHADTLKVHYVIFDGKIWSQLYKDEGWRDYTQGGDDVTLGHFDHVHVSIQNPHGDG